MTKLLKFCCCCFLLFTACGQPSSETEQVSSKVTSENQNEPRSSYKVLTSLTDYFIQDMIRQKSLFLQVKLEKKEMLLHDFYEDKFTKKILKLELEKIDIDLNTKLDSLEGLMNTFSGMNTMMMMVNCSNPPNCFPTGGVNCGNGGNCFGMNLIERLIWPLDGLSHKLIIRNMNGKVIGETGDAEKMNEGFMASSLITNNASFSGNAILEYTNSQGGFYKTNVMIENSQR